MRLFWGLIAVSLFVFWISVDVSEARAEKSAHGRPKSGLNLKLKPDFMDKIRKMEFKDVRWSNLAPVFSKLEAQLNSMLKRDPSNVMKMMNNAAKLPTRPPNPSLNEELNATMIEELDSTVFITQFINYIITGEFDGTTVYSDDYDMLTLDAILGLGLQLFISIVTLEDPVPDYAFC